MLCLEALLIANLDNAGWKGSHNKSIKEAICRVQMNFNYKV